MQSSGGSVPCRSDWDRRILKHSLVLFFLVSTAHAAITEFANPADIILRNGKIFTDKTTGRIWSQALSIRDGTIQSIGANSALDKEKGPATKVIDLKGRVVLSGFNDSHSSILDASIWGSRVDLA